MNTLVNMGELKFDLLMTHSPTEVSGRGWLHPAKMECECTRADLSRLLVGAKIWNQEILGIESFAVEDQSFKTISILLGKKMW